MKKNNHFFFLLFFFILFQFINQETFPDYESYKRIYSIFNFDFDKNWEPLFTFLNFGFNLLGFSYDNFRIFILIISLSCIYFTTKNIQKIYPLEKSKINFLFKTFLYSILSIILFEFFIIRIRGGLSSAFFILGFSHLIIRKLKKINLLLGIILILISSQIHFNNFLILSFFLLIPLIASKLTFNKTLIFLYIVFSIMVSIFLITKLDVSVEDRGSNTFSKLNFFRFLIISVIPVGIYFISKIYHLINDSFNIKIRHQLIPIRFITINYISLAIALIILYPLGITDYSGEAIVRIFTLSSIVFIPIMSVFEIDHWWLWFYLSLTNSLFFINTIFL